MRAHVLLALALAVVPVAACSGSSGTKHSSQPAAAATAPGDTSAAKAAITKTWTDFFGPTMPVAQKAALLEDGSSMGAALALAAKNPAATVTTATVDTITFSGPAKAAVTYDLTISGNKVLTGANGDAVLQDGTWKISKFTFCQLQKLGSKTGTFPDCP